MSTQSLTLIHPTPIQFLPQIYNLESISYPPDEAATEQKLRYRLNNASDYFMSWWVPSESYDEKDTASRLIGFICSTKHQDNLVSHHSMQEHQDQSSVLHIHSVVVHPEHRRKGLASKFLSEYIAIMRERGAHDVRRIVLMCKDDLIGFYKSAGFILKGVSACEHGEDKWYDMYLDLHAEDSAEKES